MRLATIAVGVLLVGSTFLLTRAVYSGEEKPGGGQKGPTPEQMAEMMKLATPGPEHEEMAKYAGNWETECTDCQNPEGPKSKGTVVSKTVLGGRFLLSEYKGEMGGMAFEGLAIEGFDNKKKEWFSIWMDSMGTTHVRSTGGAVKDGVRTMVSESFDCGWGPTSMRLVETRKDADNMSMEMFMKTGSEPEAKSMVMTYKRKK